MRERGSKGEDQKAEFAILSATSRGNGTVYQRGTGRLCEKRNRDIETQFLEDAIEHAYQLVQKQEREGDFYQQSLFHMGGYDGMK